MASSELLISEGKKGVSSTVPTKPQQHKRMPSTLQGEEDRFYLLVLTCCCNKLLDVLYGSSVAVIIAPLFVWPLVATRCGCPWPHSPDYAPHFLHQKDYAYPFRTSTTQQAVPAYACSTKDEDQMPVALNAPSSTQAGGYPVVVLDSGCSFHMTGFGEVLQNREHMTGSVFGISGHALPITGQGSIMGTPVPIWLDNVRYVQDLPRLLVSVSQITRARVARVVFEPDCCRVERMSDGCTIGCGRRVGDLYTLECLTPG